MRYAILVVAVLAVGCSSSQSPTAPTPIVPVASVPIASAPVTTAPAVVPNPLLSDARFDPLFYRQFALGSRDGGPYALRRLTQAPRLYLRTVDDAGQPIDSFTLVETATALSSVVGSLTGAFGLAGLEQGAETRQGQAGWITVRWSHVASANNFCGSGLYAGDLITLYPRTPGCRCAGGPAVRLKTVKHELGHVLGFYHTDSENDLMFQGGSACDKNPSAREIFHARVAYSQPIGSRDPS